MKAGDRVKRADWRESSVAAYRSMIGTVERVDDYRVWVVWDADLTVTRDPSGPYPETMLEKAT